VANWKQIALADDLPTIFDGGSAGLVPRPTLGIGEDTREWCLNAGGTYTKTRSDGNYESFSALSDTPTFNTAEAGSIVKYVLGIRITGMAHDATINTVSVYCESQHGLSQGDTVAVNNCNVSAYNGTKTVTSIIGSQGTEGGDSTVFTFSSSDATAITILGYISNTSVDDNMLIWDSDETNTVDQVLTSTSQNPISSLGVYGHITSNTYKDTIDRLGTITSGVWNGTAIADADIASATTWNAKLDSTLIDTLDVDDQVISNAKTVGFFIEESLGTKTTDFTINFSDAQKQFVTLGAGTMTVTLSTTSLNIGNYLLRVNVGATPPTLTWSGVKWPGGTAPTLTAGDHILSFYYNGTNFYGVASLEFA